MQEAERSLCVLVQEMGDDVLILLRFFYREEGIFEAPGEAVRIIVIFLIPALQGRKLGVHTHQTCHSSHILIDKPSDEVDNACVFRLSADVQQADVLRIQISAESLEEPEMRGQLSAVQVLETGEDLEVLSLEIFACAFGVSHARVP